MRPVNRIIPKLRSSSMDKSLFLGVCLLCILGEVWGTWKRLPHYRYVRPKKVGKTIDPATISGAIRANIGKTGISPRALMSGVADRGAKPVPIAWIRKVIIKVNESINSALNTDRADFPTRTSRAPFAFGPHLISSETARRIGRSGRLYVETTRQVINDHFSPVWPGGDRAVLGCPFDVVPQCYKLSPFRTITGVCNNLINPLWGSSNTPFERSVVPAYENGVSDPRNESVQGGPLPLAREVSTAIHEASGVRNLDRRFTHITMEFGQFVSHDIERFAPIEAPDGSELVCCRSPSVKSDRLGCLAIDIPDNDPFFSQFDRRCMEFARALVTPNLQCELGVREQLNQESAYLDASAVYGSTRELNEELRRFKGGLLNTVRGPDGELLLQDESLRSPQCRSRAPRPRPCFKAGDARVNQQPALMSMHTIWLREHNRVARELARINSKWDDERLFQEARKIVGAEFQHVVYNEFLPVLVGKHVAKAFDFPAQKRGFNSDYDPSINAQIRSSFSSAGYRVGHTLVQTFFADSLKFRDHFLRPDVLYERRTSVSFVIKNLFTNNQQMCDRLISPQLTNTLFEQEPGSGIDLAATNIQRGRDFGTPSYNVFRTLCGLPPAKHFKTSHGGLVSHSKGAARLLKKVYSHVDDIDLWTGAISEKVLTGAVVGPTIACIVSRQFFLLKKGDRFFYENDDENAGFSLDKLDSIRKTSFARIICDNTVTTTAQKRVFRFPDRRSNPTVNCRAIPSVDLRLWVDEKCVNGGWSKWSKRFKCYFSYKFQFRRCNNPIPSACGKKCVGKAYRFTRCAHGLIKSNKGPLVLAREMAPSDMSFF